MLSYRLRQYLISLEPILHLIIACGLGVALGLGSIKLTPQVMLGLVAAPFGAYLLLKRPEFGVLGILVLSSTIYDSHKLPTIAIGPGRLYLTDPILVSLLGLVLLRWIVERDFNLVRTPLNAPMLFFYGVAMFSTVGSLFLTESGFSMDRFSMAIPEIRIITYYLVMFIVLNLVRTHSQMMVLIFGVLGLATFVAVMMIAQFVAGDAVQILPGRVEALLTQTTVHAEVTRILPPGESLILVAFLSATIMVVLERSTRIRFLLLIPAGLTGMAIIFTFNRSFWLSSTVSLSLFAFLIRKRDRERLAILGTALLLVMGFVLVFFVAPYPESRLTKLVVAAVERFDTVLGEKVMDDPSFRWRDAEYEHAIPQIIANPLLGLGLGARYRDWDLRLDWPGVVDLRDYIHNGHVWVILKTGFLGYFGLVWLSVLFLYRGFKHWRNIPNSHYRGAVLGVTITYLTMLPANIVNPMYLQWWWTPVIGWMMGVQSLILYWNDRGMIEGDDELG